jgi:hypothetical protein
VTKSNDGLIAGLGCAALAGYVVFAIAWVGFIAWLLYELVSWITTK